MLRESAWISDDDACGPRECRVASCCSPSTTRNIEALMRILTAILFAALALPAQATFHLWYINEIYSNADGTVQFIELKAAASGQQFIRGHTIRSSSGSTTNTYTFP